MNFAQLFSPFPSNAEESWARLHAVATEWWRAPGVRDGVPSAMLDRAEKRLRLKLPRAVRNMYCFFGRFPELTRGQVNLVKPEDLELDEDVLVLFLDEHDVACWGVRRADLWTADPPVVVRIGKVAPGRAQGAKAGGRASAPPKPPLVWELAAPRLSTFFTESALLQATESARYINWMESTSPITMPPGLAKLSTGAVVRAMREATLYGGDDILLVLDSPPSLFAVGVAASTERDYDRAIALFPGAKWKQHAESVHQPNYGEILDDLELVIRLLRSEARSRKH